MDKLYEFEKLPENVRQIGEPGEKGRIYFEDYVVTYMERLFQRMPENMVVIYLGKEGKGECAGSYFIYGAVETELELTDGKQSFSAEKWEEIHNHMKKYFPESQILGWGLGIRMETHSLKKRMEEIQRKHFAKKYQICYVSDQSEETKSVYYFDGLGLKKKHGYMVYYGKNPQMQDYTLRGKPKSSLDADYADHVITNVRAIIKKNEEKRQERKTVRAAAAIFFVLLLMAGGFILLQSNKKLERLEETLAVVSKPQLPGNGEEETSKGLERNEKSETEVLTNTGNTSEKPETEEQSPESQSGEKVTEEPEKKPDEKTAEEAGERSDKKDAEESENQSDKKATEEPKEQSDKKAAEESEKKSQKSKGQATAKEEHDEKTGKETGKKKQTRTKEEGTSQTAKMQNSYVVQKGDTLSQIVWREYRDLSKLALIKERNHIENENQIKEGQRIILPIY